MVDWALSVELIGLPFSHWTHVTFKQTIPDLVHHGVRSNSTGQAASPGPANHVAAPGLGHRDGGGRPDAGNVSRVEHDLD